MKKAIQILSVLCLVSLGCNEPEPISRCVIDRVEVLEIDTEYYNDDPDEGNPDLYIEFIERETQGILFTTAVAQDAQLPVDLDFVAVNIEEVDFGTEFGFTVFDADDATTQDFIALDLPFRVNDHVDAERTEVDIADGPTVIRVHLIWY